MKHWITEKGTCIYRMSGGQSNAYLIDTGDNLVLVDTGSALVSSRIVPRIEKQIKDRKISHLVLTHTHYDHCYNAAALISLYAPRVCVSSHELPYIEKGFTPLPSGTNRLSRHIMEYADRKMHSKIHYPPFSGDSAVDDDSDLLFGERSVRILTSPGHSRGSISIVVDSEIALVGDAMFGIFPNSIYPPFADDENQMIESWKKLHAAGCRLYLPGHGKGISAELVKKEIKHCS